MLETLSREQIAALRFLDHSSLGAFAPGSNLASITCQVFGEIEFCGSDLDVLRAAGLASARQMQTPKSLGVSSIEPEAGEQFVTHLWSLTDAGRELASTLRA